MSQGVGEIFCLPKTAWPPTLCCKIVSNHSYGVSGFDDVLNSAGSRTTLYPKNVIVYVIIQINKVLSLKILESIFP